MLVSVWVVTSTADPGKVKDFRKRGCVSLDPGAGSYCQPDGHQRDTVLAGIYEIMGDDVDGIESMTEDAERMGLL